MHSTIYEINTRVWIKRFAKKDSFPKLLDVPTDYWKSLVNKGIKYVWLMGIWETESETIEKYCFEDGLINEYNKALPDWKRKDVIGSPYAINDYCINKTLGSTNDLVKLKENLNSIGLKIILDFIPNHFAAETSLLKTNSEIFLQGNEELFAEDKQTYFRTKDGAVFAHGRDPNFAAWQDTIQVNYSSKLAREFMIGSLKNITALCNGVRCDMAMLPLNSIYQNTWRKPLSMLGIKGMEKEFWLGAIKQTKEVKNDFIFIAEAYWDTEWQLQQLGFDFTYDKRLLDRLEFGDAETILRHLHAEKEFQQKSVRFIENHDEKRAVTTFGIEKSKAAGVVMSTIQGATLYYDGQFEGRTVRLPVQLGREPNEDINNSIVEFYKNLLGIVSHKIFTNGSFNIINPIKLDEDFTYKNILSWKWKLGNDKRIVVVNYSGSSAYCRIKLSLSSIKEKVLLIDLLNNREYERDVKEIIEYGLFIHLRAFESHIFEIK